jgi:hypothetical protein
MMYPVFGMQEAMEYWTPAASGIPHRTGEATNAESMFSHQPNLGIIALLLTT